MKRILTVATAAFLLVGCVENPDPVRDAIRVEILNMEQNFTSVNFRSLEKVDSSTFAQELDRKINTFELKKQSDERFLLKYTQEKKMKNAEIKRASYIEDIRILSSLDSLRGALAPVLDDIAYYVYRFSADARGEASSMSFADAYAALTPSNEVVGIASRFADLSKRLGKVVPGYLEVVETGGPADLESADAEEE